MSNDYDKLICICGKNKKAMNMRNWQRHIAACRLRKDSKSNIDIKSMFIVQTNKRKHGKYLSIIYKLIIIKYY